MLKNLGLVLSLFAASGFSAQAADLKPQWSTQPSLQLSQGQQSVSVNLDANAQRIFFRADAGQILITDLSLALDDGSTLALSDLIATNGTSEFGQGVIDLTGSQTFPRSVFLNLPQMIHLSSITVSFVQNVSPASLFISVLAPGTSSGGNPDPTPIATSGPVTPVNPLPIVPVSSCDIDGLNQQIGACSANQQNSTAQLAALSYQSGNLQGQLSALGYLSQQYNECQTATNNLNNQLAGIVQEIQQLDAQRDQILADTQAKQAKIDYLSHAVPRGWKCWLRDRHGNLCNASGNGTQIDVLKQILQDSTGNGQRSNCSGDGNIGKGDWNMNGNWGCDPL